MPEKPKERPGERVSSKEVERPSRETEEGVVKAAEQQVEQFGQEGLTKAEEMAQRVDGEVDEETRGALAVLVDKASGAVEKVKAHFRERKELKAKWQEYRQAAAEIQKKGYDDKVDFDEVCDLFTKYSQKARELPDDQLGTAKSVELFSAWNGAEDAMMKKLNSHWQELGEQTGGQGDIEAWLKFYDQICGLRMYFRRDDCRKSKDEIRTRTARETYNHTTTMVPSAEQDLRVRHEKARQILLERAPGVGVYLMDGAQRDYIGPRTTYSADQWLEVIKRVVDENKDFGSLQLAHFWDIPKDQLTPELQRAIFQTHKANPWAENPENKVLVGRADHLLDAWREIDVQEREKMIKKYQERWPGSEHPHQMVELIQADLVDPAWLSKKYKEAAAVAIVFNVSTPAEAKPITALALDQSSIGELYGAIAEQETYGATTAGEAVDKEKGLEKVKLFEQAMDIKPTPAIANRAYNKLVHIGKLDSFLALEKHIGIEAGKEERFDFDSLYASLIGRGEVVKFLQEQEKRGVNISERSAKQMAQKGYEALIKRHELGHWGDFAKLMGVPANKDVVWGGYAVLLETGRYEEAAQLEALTNVDASAHITNTFNELISEGDADAIVRLEEGVGRELTATPEKAQQGYLHLIKSALISKIPELRKALHDIPIEPETAQQGYAEWLVHEEGKGANFTGLEGALDKLKLENSERFKPDWERIGANLPMRKIWKIAAMEVPELEGSNSWYDALKALRKVQDFAAREEHDPWRTELQPLADDALEDVFTSSDKPTLERSREDGEIFVDFVKEFGAFNLPSLLGVYADLRKTKDFRDLRLETREFLDEALGAKRVEKLDAPANILNEIRRFRRDTQSELLKDNTPKGIESKLGLEILNALRETTRWSQSSPTEKLVGMWKETLEKKPEVAELPDGYKEKTVKVPVLVREEGGGEDKTKAILEGKKLQAAFVNLREMLKCPAAVDGWDQREQKLQVIKQMFARREEQMGKLEQAPEVARAGMQKSIDKLDEAIAQIQGIELSTEGDLEKNLVEYMEKLLSLRVKETDELIRSISVAHMDRAVPEGWEAHMKEISDHEGDLTSDAVRHSAEFIEQYLKEHYLHPEQEEHHTHHSPFSRELLNKLQKLWKTEAKKGEHLIVKSAEKLRAAEEGKRVESSKTIDVTFVPVKGLLRVFAGNIGDACYTSKADKLAKGEFGKLTGVIMVTGRNTAQERLAGSALFIEADLMETKTQQEGSMLMIRANNPRQNLLGKVDADALVAETLTYAAETAERRKKEKVGVPLDGSSQSSSNRPEVPKYYREHYKDQPKLWLVDEPETNFNGYNNWNPDAGHPVVEAWSKAA